MKGPRNLHFACLLGLLLLAACQTLPPSPPAPASAPTLPAPPPPDAISEAYAYFARATLALQSGAPEEARAYLQAALDRDPDSPYLCAGMAYLLKDLEAYDEALAYALKCRRLKPEDLDYQILTADLYALKGEDAAAIEALTQVLEQDPHNHRIRLLLNTLLIRSARYDEALDNLGQLLAERSDLPVAYYYYGRVQLELEHYPEAEEALQNALRLNRRFEPALFDLGTLYQLTGRPDQAIEVFVGLIAMFPENLSARERLANLYLGRKETLKAEEQLRIIRAGSEPGDRQRQALGLIYLRQGRLDEAIEELRLIVTAFPNDHKSRYFLANAYEDDQKLQKALYHFRQIPPDSEYAVNARLHIAYLLDELDRYDEAVATLRQALEDGFRQPEVYSVLASIYEGHEAYTEALATVEAGLVQHPRNTELMFRLGAILDKMGRKDAALAQMQRVLAVDPDHADTLNYIGYSYAEQGVRLDEALRLIQRALEIKPDSGYIIDSLGWVHFQRGDYAQALQHLQRAAELAPDDPTINEHLGDACFRQGLYAEALAAYEKALAVEPPDPDRIRQKIRAVKERRQP